MNDWKTTLAGIATDADRVFDGLKYRLVERMRGNDPIIILPYRGYGTQQELRIRGRVLEDSGLKRAGDRDSLWDNLLATWRRIESDEVPGVRVCGQFQGAERETVADHEGFFELAIPISEPLGDEEYRCEVELWLPDEVRGQTGIHCTGEVFVPPLVADYGVISDIDDTIIRTDATNLLMAARLTFLGNARTRMPFEGVSELYRAFVAGPGGTNRNPIFYVSSGPWNLYDLLVDFMELNHIPHGPIFLQDFGLEPGSFVHADHHTHKFARIATILSTYPELRFILIGDSGQEDPEIYRAITEEFPGRISAIYIRDVSLDKRDTEVKHICDNVKCELGMLLVPDSRAAAEHAIEAGLIAPDAFAAIDMETARDQTATEMPKA